MSSAFVFFIYDNSGTQYFLWRIDNVTCYRSVTCLQFKGPCLNSKHILTRMRALKSIKIRDNSTPIKNSHNKDNECFVCCKTTHQTWHVYDGDKTYCLVTHYLSTLSIGIILFCHLLIYTCISGVFRGGGAAVSSEMFKQCCRKPFCTAVITKIICLFRLYHHAKNYVMTHKIWTTM